MKQTLRFLLRDRIVAARVPWTASAQAACGERRASQRAILSDGLGRVLRACGMKPACARRQARRDEALICTDRGDAHLGCAHGDRLRERKAGMVCASWLRRSANEIVAAAGRHATTYQRGSDGASIDSRMALQRRRTRLRTTALPTLRVMTTPTFGAPDSRARGEN